MIDFKQWYKSGDGFDVLSNNSKIELIELIEFKVIKTDNGFKIIDLIASNIGFIEKENFQTLKDVCERLTKYFDDYFKE